jgi:WD40 repeat protein
MSSQFHSRPARIFLVFAYKDRAFRDALVKHLTPLRQVGVIDNWHEYEIPAGGDWQKIDKERLNEADIILLLITADFIASEHSYTIQMQRALERNKAGEARVIPILCRPLYLEDLPLAKLQFLPRSDQQKIKAVSEWVNKDKVYAEIVTEIRKAIGELFGSSPIQVPPQPGTTSQPQGTRYLTYNGHSNYVISAVWSSNGKYIASGGGDNTVRIWNPNTGNTLYTYRIHKSTTIRPSFLSEVLSIIWSPDNTTIAFAGKQAPMIWNPFNDQIITTYKSHSPIFPIIASMAWSSDGQSIASTNIGSPKDQAIHVWSPQNGQQIAKIDVSKGWTDTDPVGGVAWSPDSKRIACGLHGEIRIYNVRTKQHIQTYKNKSAWAYYSVCWSRDNTRLVCAFPKEAVVWDITTGELMHKYIDHKADIRDIALSPDGKYVASASNDTTVHIWETDTGNRIFTYEGHRDKVAAVTWSPDGKRVASGCADGTVHVWQAI